MDVIGLRMKAFQDMYEVTDNLGETRHLQRAWTWSWAGADDGAAEERAQTPLLSAAINHVSAGTFS